MSPLLPAFLTGLGASRAAWELPLSLSLSLSSHRDTVSFSLSLSLSLLLLDAAWEVPALQSAKLSAGTNLSWGVVRNDPSTKVPSKVWALQAFDEGPLPEVRGWWGAAGRHKARADTFKGREPSKLPGKVPSKGGQRDL